jgi:hypothetical protein
MGIALEGDVGHGLSSPPTAQVGLGYHATMRWILSVVLLAACALASALPTADPPATDDVSGLISQPAPGWKPEHWFNSEPLALQDWWLDGHERSWTSVSFLIDRRGVIRHVHLGGKLAPDTDDFA